MKTKKRRMEYISFYNHTGLEEHFTKMAKKGWLIESISNFYWTYRKIEPKDLHFCVTYYPRASDFDPGPTEEQQTFHDFCAHTGWQLTCTWHQMQVFYNEKENPIPLETDPVLEVETLHKACKKNFLPSYFLLLALGLLMGGYFVARIFADPIGLLSDPSHLMTGTAYVCMAIISITELLSYFLWYTKAKRAAQNGIDSVVLPRKEYADIAAYSKALADTLTAANIDLVVLAGFMTIFDEQVYKAFPNKILNVHPALIPSFCGKGFYGLHVHEAALAKGVKISGATVHIVIPECDAGPIVLQKAVEVKQDDTPETLQLRIMQEAEWKILPEAVRLFCDGKIEVRDNKVYIK